MSSASRRLTGMSRYGPSGSPARCVRRCARRSASRRRYTGGAWTSIRRAAHSTSRGRAKRSGTLRASAYGKESHALLTGTVNTGGSKIQERLFSPARSSREKYAELVVGRPGPGALIKYELVVLAAQAV